jgi:hypothetical protein
MRFGTTFVGQRDDHATPIFGRSTALNQASPSQPIDQPSGRTHGGTRPAGQPTHI